MSLRRATLILVSFFAAVAPATAATVRFGEPAGSLRYTAAPADASDLTASTHLARGVVLAAARAPLSAWEGGSPGSTVSCFTTYGTPVKLLIDLGDRADRLNLYGNLIGCLEPEISAGPGDDTIDRSPFQNCPDVPQTIDGGPGDDTIR